MIPHRLSIRRRSLLAGAAALAAPSLARAQAARPLRFVPHANLSVVDPVASTAYVTRNHGFLVWDTLYALDESYEQGGLHAYLGILNALRPPALGGRPDVSKRHFERAIELSAGRDLSIKVEYARRYARMMFEQDLHDRLLAEVLEAPAEAPGLTLFYVLAKQEAEQLLASSREYF